MLSRATYLVSIGNTFKSHASPVASTTLSRALLPVTLKADKLPLQPRFQGLSSLPPLIAGRPREAKKRDPGNEVAASGTTSFPGSSLLTLLSRGRERTLGTRMPLETEPVACDNNTIFLQTKLSFHLTQLIIVVTLRSSARVFYISSCSQMPVVFYHSVIHDLGFFIC